MLNGFAFVEMTNQILSINNARLETFLAILKCLVCSTPMLNMIILGLIVLLIPYVLDKNMVSSYVNVYAKIEPPSLC